MNAFSYHKGNISTTLPWHRPCVEQFAHILSENQDFFTRYQCFVYGGFLTDTDTWDIDILVVSELTPQIGDDCVRLCNHAHDQQQLLDITIVSADWFHAFVQQSTHYNRTGEFKLISQISDTVSDVVYKPHDCVYKNGDLLDDANRLYVPIQQNVWQLTWKPGTVVSAQLPHKIACRGHIAMPVSVAQWQKNQKHSCKF